MLSLAIARDHLVQHRACLHVIWQLVHTLALVHARGDVLDPAQESVTELVKGVVWAIATHLVLAKQRMGHIIPHPIIMLIALRPVRNAQNAVAHVYPHAKMDVREDVIRDVKVIVKVVVRTGVTQVVKEIVREDARGHAKQVAQVVQVLVIRDAICHVPALAKAVA